MVMINKTLKSLIFGLLFTFSIPLSAQAFWWGSFGGAYHGASFRIGYSSAGRYYSAGSYPGYFRYGSYYPSFHRSYYGLGWLNSGKRFYSTQSLIQADKQRQAIEKLMIAKIQAAHIQPKTTTTYQFHLKNEEKEFESFEQLNSPQIFREEKNKEIKQPQETIINKEEKVVINYY